MAIGIIGPPQSGKTTVFNAVTRGRAEVASFRAPGRQPNVGVVKVPDPRLDALAAMTRSRRVVPAEVSYVDAPGAAEGGIDGVYLNTLQRCEALLLVARAFDDPSAPAPGGVVDPVRDALATQAELAFSDLLLLERRAERIAKQLRAAKASERDALTREAALVDRVRAALDGGAAVREQTLDAGERRILDNFQLLTAKPLMAVFNIGEEDVGKEEVEAALAERLAAPGVAAIALCGKLEMELAQMAPEDEAEFRASLGAGEPGPRPDGAPLLPPAGAGFVPDHGGGRDARVDDYRPRPGGRGGRQGPLRHPARLHPRRGYGLRRPDAGGRVHGGAPRRAAASGGQAVSDARRRRGQLPVQRVRRRWEEGARL